MRRGWNACGNWGHSQYPTLRHVPMSVFEEYQGQLPPLVAKRVKHNLTENLRVEKFAQSLKDNNYTIAGELLYQSHASLKDDFEVSCKELDDIVAIAKEIPGVSWLPDDGRWIWRVCGRVSQSPSRGRIYAIIHRRVL